MHNLCEQATIPAKQRVENFGSSKEPIKLQRLLATLSHWSPVGCGPFHTKHTFEKAQMRSLKGAVKSTALLHEPCSPDLGSIYSGGESVTFSQPKESMWPVIQLMLLRKLPNSVTTSHERIKHMFSRFGGVMCPIETMPRYWNESLLASGAPPALKAGTLKP